MIREVIFPWSLVSANRQERQHRRQNIGQQAALKAAVRWALESTLPACRPVIDNRPNTFTVTFTRYSPRAYEKHDNLRTALKHAVDMTAMWIFGGTQLGVDDGRANFIPLYAWKPSPTERLGIEIIDNDVLAPARRELADIEGARKKAAPSAKAAPKKVIASAAPTQRHLVFRPAWFAQPWDQHAGDDGYNVRDASQLVAMLREPLVLVVIHPDTGREVRLYRHDHTDPDLGGRVWLYTARRPAPPALAVAKGETGT